MLRKKKEMKEGIRKRTLTDIIVHRKRKREKVKTEKKEYCKGRSRKGTIIGEDKIPVLFIADKL